MTCCSSTAPAAHNVDNATHIMMLVWAEFLARGFELCTDHGETMPMFTFAGPGSSEAKRRFWIDKSGQLDFLTEHGAKSIKATHRYKHLGTCASDNLRLGPEILAKRARMQSAAALFKKRSSPIRPSLRQLAPLWRTAIC